MINGIKLSAEEIVGDLDFADDITMLQSCKQRLKELLNRISEKTRIRINLSKTKTMALLIPHFISDVEKRKLNNSWNTGTLEAYWRIRDQHPTK